MIFRDSALIVEGLVESDLEGLGCEMEKADVEYPEFWLDASLAEDVCVEEWEEEQVEELN